MVVSVDIMTSGLYLNEEFLNRGGIFVSDQVGFRYDGGTVLKIDETIGAGEIEVYFLRIHQVEYRYVMLSVSEVLKSITKGIRIAEEIREDEDQGSLPDFLCHGMEGIHEAGLAFRFQFTKNLEKVLQMGRAPAGRQFEVQSIIAA